MGKTAQHNDDERRLPEGMTRIGYDADTEIYTYQDADGKMYEGAPGDKYGMVRPVGWRQRSRAIAAEAAPVKKEEWKNPFHTPHPPNVEGDKESVLAKLRRSLTDTIRSITPRRLSDLGSSSATFDRPRRTTFSNGGLTRSSRGHERLPDSPTENTTTQGEQSTEREKRFSQELGALFAKGKKSSRRATTTE